MQVQLKQSFHIVQCARYFPVIRLGEGDCFTDKTRRMIKEEVTSVIVVQVHLCFNFIPN